MLIGQDYPKLDFYIGKLHLLEPNGTITDLLMAALSFYFAISLQNVKNKDAFTRMWMAFFLLHGLGSFFGALGHALYLYWGIYGKIATWITGVLSIYAIEKAFIDQLENTSQRTLFEKIAFWKIPSIYLAIVLICLLSDVSLKPELPFLPVAINTIVGVVFSAGYLAYTFSKSKNAIYRYFYWGVMVILPSAFFFLLKINPFPWFDKNDFSHVFMCGGITLFYIGVKKRLQLNT